MNPYAAIMKKSPAIATNSALQAGADPQDLALAKKELGKQEYIGYCETFVEKATGSGNQGATASDAWNNQQDKAIQGLEGVRPGDKIYFSDPNNPAGHVGLADQGGNFVSATDNGIQENNINDWMKTTGQQALGYIPQQENPYARIMKGTN